MQHTIDELLNNVFKYSKSFQDETNLINIPWVLIEEEPAARKTYLLRNSEELVIYVEGDISRHGKWVVSKTTTYLTVEIDGETTFFERGFLSDTFMLLEKDDGTYRLFINEKKLKDKDKLPSFENCMTYLTKHTKEAVASNPATETTKVHAIAIGVFLVLGIGLMAISYMLIGGGALIISLILFITKPQTVGGVTKFADKGGLTILAILFLTIGILITTLASLFWASIETQGSGYDFGGFIPFMAIVFLGIPSLILGAIFGVSSIIIRVQVKMLQKKNATIDLF